MNPARIKLMTLLLEAPVKPQTVNLVRYGMIEIESVLQRTCYKDKYHIFKFCHALKAIFYIKWMGVIIVK